MQLTISSEKLRLHATNGIQFTNPFSPTALKRECTRISPRTYDRAKTTNFKLVAKYFGLSWHDIDMLVVHVQEIRAFNTHAPQKFRKVSLSVSLSLSLSLSLRDAIKNSCVAKLAGSYSQIPILSSNVNLNDKFNVWNHRQSQFRPTEHHLHLCPQMKQVW